MVSTSKGFWTDEIPVLPIPKNDRTRSMTKTFQERFKSAPDFFARAPGRVNIIGEHIDYSGYGVLPMALQQDIMLAVKRNADDDFEVKLVNMDSKYADYQFDIRNFEITIVNQPEWYHYILSGVKGMLEYKKDNETPKGFSMVVSGTIPPAAGLSSSSALVCAAAIATGELNKKVLDVAQTKERFAEICSHSERLYIGTQGGGMDQAIAFLAMQDCAKSIEFNPLRATNVPLPARGVFVVANSLVEINKAATSDYNCRVVECKLASQLLAHKKGLQWDPPLKLGDLQRSDGGTLEDMVNFLEENLHDDPYTKNEIATELGTTIQHLEEISFTPNTKHIQSFKLKQRARHVYREALRVASFIEKCNTHDPSEQPEERIEERVKREVLLLRKLGMLMYKSHESLKDDFECSHPKLDRLLDLSRGKALGARLTGAGWGGCIVALLLPEEVEGYINLLKSEYYQQLGAGESVDSHVFVTSPSCGACVCI